MDFKTLGIFEPLLKAIKELGYEKATTIQQRAIPYIFQKKDIFATAQTGTGKTAAFALPILQKLKKHHNSKIRALILAPTKELSIQIKEDIDSYAKYLDIKTMAIIGAKELISQKKALKSQNADILVATPGRIIEHLNTGLELKEIEFFVLDEADRMLDMGFSKDIKTIVSFLNKKHQTLLFSATYSDKVRKLSKLILKKPVFIETAKKNSTVENINQIAYLVDEDKKAECCAYLIGSRNFSQVLVFTKTKSSADELVKELKKFALKAEVIHGDIQKSTRLKRLNQFKEKKINVLVATDIASRGLDIEDLPFVINYELPALAQDYVHRVGRTGRAGKYGEAISLLDIYERSEIKKIEKLISKKIKKETLEGFEPNPNKRRIDKDEIKLKNEHKQDTKRYKKPKKTAKQKKRKTTKRDSRR